MKYLPLVFFCLLGIIWGSNFIYMKLASELISPFQIVLLRMVLGMIPVAIYAHFKGDLKLSHFRHLGHFLVMSFVGTIVYYYGFVKGSSLLASGVVGALSGLTPIFSYMLALLLISDEKASLQKVAGIVIGFTGVFLIANPFSVDLSSSNYEGVLYAIAGSFGIGASFVYAKKYLLPLNIPSSALITYQLGLGVIILLPVTDFNNINNIWTDAHAAAGLVIGLGILGTGVAYIMYYFIIEKLGAVTASSVAYIPPVVALIIGVFLVGEEIVAREYLGTGLILGGVILTSQKKTMRS